MKEMIENTFTSESLKIMVNKILDEAKRQGATHAEVDIHTHKGFTVTVRKGDVETIEYHQDKNIGVTVYMGKRGGAASLSDLRPEAIQSAVNAACNIARFTDEDPYSGLADKNLLAFQYPEIHLDFPWELTVPDAIQLAKECESIALAKDKRIQNSEGATISTSRVINAYGNSQGFVGAFPVTRHEISCVLIANQNNEMQRDYYYTVAADKALLDSIQTVATLAAERTVRRLGGKRLTTRRVPVIFAAEESRGLLGLFVSSISGSNLYRKSSFLVDHLGKKVFPDNIQIHENPFLEKALGSSPFDDDGVATKKNVFIKDGVLQNYVLGVYSARKLGMETTGNAGGVHNLMISTSDKNFSELLKTMGSGLLVTELMGQGVNLTNGDYSRGVAGFWVENGEICYPVEEITIAGNLRDMFGGIVHVGNDIDKRGNIQTGSILIDQMMV
ncbi:MAG TPA: metalloprotease PmbA, partial [Gammaproteobacteria bacterium]|nr:metalloprotease PmbA [Gammaproteobacteria bacterium]